jgi:N-acetylmuramoyl-L-alanine amidase
VNGTLQSLPWFGQFPSGTQVQLEAVPDSGWGFANWTGDLSGSVITTSINMNSNKNGVANFSLPFIGNLENPSNGQKISGITTIHGWALDGKKVTKVELYVDGTYAGDIPYGGSRDDVKDVYPQYPNADLSGFGLITNYSFLSPGNHNIAVRLYNQDGQTKDMAATITVVRFSGDFVTQVKPDSFWLNNISVTIEGVTKTYDIQVQWSNASQGFEIKEIALEGDSSSNLENENYLKPVSQSFSISSESLSTLPLIGYLENPSNGQKVSGITTIHGWALDGKKVTKVELYVDGTYAGDIPYGGSRDDVKDVYPQYPNADLSGFVLIINYAILSPGTHNIAVRLYNQDGETKDLTATVTVVRFHGDFATQVIPDSFLLNKVNVRIEDITKKYNIQIQWSNASQGFEIIEVVPTGD